MQVAFSVKYFSGSPVLIGKQGLHEYWFRKSFHLVYIRIILLQRPCDEKIRVWFVYKINYYCDLYIISWIYSILFFILHLTLTTCFGWMLIVTNLWEKHYWTNRFLVCVFWWRSSIIGSEIACSWGINNYIFIYIGFFVFIWSERRVFGWRIMSLLLLLSNWAFFWRRHLC